MEWLALGIGAALLIALWLRFRSPRPEFMPLATDPDDPALLAATEQARRTIAQFRALYSRYPEDAFIKLSFTSTSSSGEVEHLVAHVEGIDGDRLDILLVTPPVTHQGQVERRCEISIDEIEDWQVTEPGGAIHGGFVQRAMFDIARRDGATLPPKLKKMEQAYVPLETPDQSIH